MFTLSSTKHGLFEVLPESPTAAENGAEIAMRLFVLNADAKKAVAAASDVIALGKKLDLEKTIVAIVGKPKANKQAEVATDKADTVLKLTVTGNQILKRALAIKALAESDIQPEVVRSSQTGTRKQGRGLAAGLTK